MHCTIDTSKYSSKYACPAVKQPATSRQCLQGSHGPKISLTTISPLPPPDLNPLGDYHHYYSPLPLPSAPWARGRMDNSCSALAPAPSPAPAVNFAMPLSCRVQVGWKTAISTNAAPSPPPLPSQLPPTLPPPSHPQLTPSPRSRPHYRFFHISSNNTERPVHVKKTASIPRQQLPKHVVRFLYSEHKRQDQVHTARLHDQAHAARLFTLCRRQ